MATATPTTATPLHMGLRLNLSVMMFLEFAIWGAWFSVLGNRLRAMGLADSIGTIFGTMALGTIFTPLVIGQIADRYFSSERLMAVLHLAGAGLLYWLSQIPPVADPAAHADLVAATASKFWWIALAYALIYSPTIALSNSIAFTHLPNGTRDFPGIRVLGTIGWIAAGMSLDFVVARFVSDPKLTNFPLVMASGLSLLLGLYSLLLPHTPPKGKAGDAIPFLRALKLLREPSFAVFFAVSFVITIVLAFYYNYTGLFLESHLGVENVASTMTIGQWSEMILLPFLPFFLYRFGMKWVLAMGMLAWGIRYGVFSLGQPYWLVIGLLTLHGVCYDFFFAAGFIHVDNESPSDIRGSAQALFTFLTYGLGMWIGSEFSGVMFTKYVALTSSAAETKTVTISDWSLSGWINHEIVTSTSKLTAAGWDLFWMVPAIGVLAALLIFVVFFRVNPRESVKEEPIIGV
jgi:nucleoside transporter